MNKHVVGSYLIVMYILSFLVIFPPGPARGGLPRWSPIVGPAIGLVILTVSLLRYRRQMRRRRMAPVPRTTRGDVVAELLAIWDETLGACPELKEEQAIAVEWLTRTWRTHELADLPSAGEFNPEGFCPECGAFLGHFYNNRIDWRKPSCNETKSKLRKL